MAQSHNSFVARCAVLWSNVVISDTHTRRTALHCVWGWYHYWHLCSISSLAVCLYKAIGGSFHSWIYNFHFSQWFICRLCEASEFQLLLFLVGVAVIDRLQKPQKEIWSFHPSDWRPVRPSVPLWTWKCNFILLQIFFMCISEVAMEIASILLAFLRSILLCAMNYGNLISKTHFSQRKTLNCSCNTSNCPILILTICCFSISIWGCLPNNKAIMFFNDLKRFL